MQFWRQTVAGLMLTSTVTTGYAADISVTGWDYSLPNSITNAGEYYSSTLESELPTTATVSISGLMNPTDTWKVVASTNVTGIGIEVRCDSGAMSNCSYKKLTAGEQDIFNGTGNHPNIPLKFKITNFDVTDGTDIEDITIQYRVVTP